MNLAVDVAYRNDKAFVAGVWFDQWGAYIPEQIYSTVVSEVNPYQSGEFYKRELPCILQLLSEHRLEPECVVIDGYVYLGGHSKPGLGKHLFDALGGSVKVIGVAKEPFRDISDQYQLIRGQSRRPLYVTSEGYSLNEAKELIASMHGAYRLPTLLKEADTQCRSMV